MIESTRFLCTSPGHFASTCSRKRLLISKMIWRWRGSTFWKSADAPLLERLGQQRVIGVGKGARDEAPRLVPRHAVLVVEEPHQLDDGDRRMRVVELDGDLVRESPPKSSLSLRKRRKMSRSEQATKKYCCTRRSSLPLSVLSFG